MEYFLENFKSFQIYANLHQFKGLSSEIRNNGCDWHTRTNLSQLNLPSLSTVAIKNTFELICFSLPGHTLVFKIITSQTEF